MNYNRYTTQRDFSPNTGMSSPRIKEQRRVNTSCSLRRKEIEESRAEDALTDEQNKTKPKKIDKSSSTASLAAIMLTCMIDVSERSDVATINISGAFLQTKMPKEKTTCTSY